MDKFHIVFLAMYLISEIIAWIPQLQSNSLLQLVMNMLKTLAGNGSGL